MGYKNSERFFHNQDCPYVPCHENWEDDCEDFNCMFCYCPLYGMNPCPGTPKKLVTKQGEIIKDCSFCTFVHKAENYDKIVECLRKGYQRNEE